MKRITSPIYRFGVVAAAIGVNEQTLRNWLFRAKDLDLFTERPQGGWRSFDERDVWVLAIVVELMRFGATINEAVDAARQAMDIRRNGRTLEGVPHSLFAAPAPDGWFVGEDKSLVLHHGGGGAVLEIPMRGVLSAAVQRLDLANGADSSLRISAALEPSAPARR